MQVSPRRPRELQFTLFAPLPLTHIQVPRLGKFARIARSEHLRSPSPEVIEVGEGSQEISRYLTFVELLKTFRNIFRAS